MHVCLVGVLNKNVARTSSIKPIILNYFHLGFLYSLFSLNKRPSSPYPYGSVDEQEQQANSFCLLHTQPLVLFLLQPSLLNGSCLGLATLCRSVSTLVVSRSKLRTTAGQDLVWNVEESKWVLCQRTSKGKGNVLQKAG
jgi:hypothetical protein